MSQENVDKFMRTLEAYNRRDVEALLADAHPDVEWRSAILMELSGKDTVYRGHEGVRQLMRDLDDTLAEIHGEYSDVRDLGDRVLGVGRVRIRGKASGIATESPVATVTDFRDGQYTRVRTYLDPGEAREAVGLSG